MLEILLNSYDAVGLPKHYSLIAALILISYSALKAFILKAKKQKTERISELISELNKHQKIRYKYIVEQAFQNRYGIIIDFPIIKLLTKSKTPSSDIDDYISAKAFVTLTECETKFKYRNFILNPVQNKFLRYFYIAICYSIYMITGSLAFIISIEIPLTKFSSAASLSVTLFLILALFLIAVLFLEISFKHLAAIRLVDKYNK